MKCLVTGGAGFIGRALTRVLEARGDSVRATSRRSGSDANGTEFLAGDVTDPAAVMGWMESFRPDVVVHLAAQSLPGVSWNAPAATMNANINGTMNVLRAIRQHSPQARLVMVSSSSVYAPPIECAPLDEQAPQRGSSPYAWSKIAAEKAALLYGRHAGIDVVAIRPFFIIGPGKSGDVSSDFARRIVAVEQGAATSIPVGSLEITRDFLDITDAMDGLVRVIEAGENGLAYNLASGVPVTIRTLLDTFKIAASVNIEETIDPTLIRPIDEPYKVGNPSRLQTLGWKPRIALDESVRRILDHWRTAA